jgi:hypothetical protein
VAAVDAATDTKINRPGNRKSIARLIFFRPGNTGTLLATSQRLDRYMSDKRKALKKKQDKSKSVTLTTDTVAAPVATASNAQQSKKK